MLSSRFSDCVSKDKEEIYRKRPPAVTSDLHTQLHMYPHTHVQTYEHTQMNIMADIWDAIQIPDRKAHRSGMEIQYQDTGWGQPVRLAPRKGGSS